MWFLLIGLSQPWLRYKMPGRWTAEVETTIVFIVLLGALILTRYFGLFVQRGLHIALSPEQISAICITATAMFVLVRGGTYIVRGCLVKSKTLPKLKRSKIISVTETDAKAVDQTGASITVSKIEVEENEGGGFEQEEEEAEDVEEVKRGRLIGNLEPPLLTLVVAAGSYAALAFLVATKGLARSDEFQERDFAEYFLVGSLSSVLVSLCAGIALRFAVLALWPAMLSLQMQGS